MSRGLISGVFRAARSNSMLNQTHFGPDLHGRNCGCQVSHAHQVVSCTGESKDPIPLCRLHDAALSPSARSSSASRSILRCASADPSLLAAQVAVELAEEGIPVFLGPVGQVRDEVPDLLAGSFAQGLGPAEVGGVGLDQIGVELMLADDLAQAVADSGAAVVPVRRLRRE